MKGRSLTQVRLLPTKRIRTVAAGSGSGSGNPLGPVERPQWLVPAIRPRTRSERMRAMLSRRPGQGDGFSPGGTSFPLASEWKGRTFSSPRDGSLHDPAGASPAARHRRSPRAKGPEMGPPARLRRFPLDPGALPGLARAGGRRPLPGAAPAGAETLGHRGLGSLRKQPPGPVLRADRRGTGPASGGGGDLAPVRRGGVPGARRPARGGIADAGHSIPLALAEPEGDRERGGRRAELPPRHADRGAAARGRAEGGGPADGAGGIRRPRLGPAGARSQRPRHRGIPPAPGAGGGLVARRPHGSPEPAPDRKSVV